MDSQWFLQANGSNNTHNDFDNLGLKLGVGYHGDGNHQINFIDLFNNPVPLMVSDSGNFIFTDINAIKSINSGLVQHDLSIEKFVNGGGNPDSSIDGFINGGGNGSSGDDFKMTEVREGLFQGVGNPTHWIESYNDQVLNATTSTVAQNTGSMLEFYGYPNSTETFNLGQPPLPPVMNNYILLDRTSRRSSDEINYSNLEKRCLNLSCNTRDTPMWRRGPDGPKTLCNACGIKYKKDEERKVRKAAATNKEQNGI